MIPSQPRSRVGESRERIPWSASTSVPELIRWAREPAGLARDDLARTFAKLPGWEAGEVRPTRKQVEALARRVHVPVGSLFLREPPEESVPIPASPEQAEALSEGWAEA